MQRSTEIKIPKYTKFTKYESRELTQNNYLNKSKYLLLLVTVSSGETIPYSVNISAPHFDQHSFQINLYSKHFTPILK